MMTVDDDDDDDDEDDDDDDNDGDGHGDGDGDDDDDDEQDNDDVNQFNMLPTSHKIKENNTHTHRNISTARPQRLAFHPPSKKRPTMASATRAISNQFQYLDSQSAKAIGSYENGIFTY